MAPAIPGYPEGHTGTWQPPGQVAAFLPPASPMAFLSGATLSSQVVCLHGNIPITDGCNLSNQVLAPKHLRSFNP